MSLPTNLECSEKSQQYLSVQFTSYFIKLGHDERCFLVIDPDFLHESLVPDAKIKLSVYINGMKIIP